MQKMEFNIQLFGGRGASSFEERVRKNIEAARLKTEHFPTFKGNENYKKALSNGYRVYLGDDVGLGGTNYEKVATKLKQEGYKVRVYEDTTRVRGLHAYTVLYKRRNK